MNIASTLPLPLSYTPSPLLFLKEREHSWLPWHTSVISLLRQLRQEDHKLEASLGSSVRPCLKGKTKKGWGVAQGYSRRCSALCLGSSRSICAACFCGAKGLGAEVSPGRMERSVHGHLCPTLLLVHGRFPRAVC